MTPSKYSLSTHHSTCPISVFTSQTLNQIWCIQIWSLLHKGHSELRLKVKVKNYKISIVNTNYKLVV